jgi:cytochrome c2
MKKYLISVLFFVASMVNAQQHPLFKDADLQAGEKLIAENKCDECHIRRVGGNGSAIYNPKGRINTAGSLRGMVEYCNTELNLGFFPEDTNAVAAVLNKQFYKFR